MPESGNDKLLDYVRHDVVSEINHIGKDHTAFQSGFGTQTGPDGQKHTNAELLHAALEEKHAMGEYALQGALIKETAKNTFHGEKISPAAKKDADKIMSQTMAEHAEGLVTVSANRTGAQSTFRDVALPALMSNDKVTAIAYVDDEGHQKQASKSDWFREQSNEWVNARIEAVRAVDKKGGVTKGDKGDEFAVSDFAHEMSNAYKNRENKDGKKYIDTAEEDKHVRAMEKTLDGIQNKELRGAIIEKVKKDLAPGTPERMKFDGHEASASLRNMGMQAQLAGANGVPPEGKQSVASIGPSSGAHIG